jgi:hypothetical protein
MQKSKYKEIKEKHGMMSFYPTSVTNSEMSKHGKLLQGIQASSQVNENHLHPSPTAQEYVCAHKG